MKKEDKIKVYYSNPKICDICGKVIPYDGVKSLDKAYKRKYCGKECTDKSKEKENSRRNRPNDMYTGIYCIKNIINDKRYIGQSKDCVERKTQHFSILRLGKHYNKYLQSDWNTYGENNFEFTILEKCQKEKLDELEKKYIKLYDSCNRNKGYNIEFGGVIDIQHSEEWHELMLDGVKRRDASSFYNAKKVICLNNMEVFESIAEASRKYNVSEDMIQHCCNPIYNIYTAGELNGERLQWDYYIEGKTYTYIPYKKKQSKLIRCVTNGKIYKNKKDANLDTGCSLYAINKSLNTSNEVNNGYIFEYI